MRRNAGERGQVLPLIALTLVAVLGFSGLAVDVGFLEYRQQAQQTATDAGAGGGAEALLHRGCPSATTAQAAADAETANNGFPNGGNVTVTVQNPPSGGPYANNPCAVNVTIATQSVPTFFTRLFGYFNGMNETTTATAIVSASGTACIYLLSSTQASDISNAHIDGPNCGMVINDTANMSNSTIDLNSISYAGAPPNVSGATFPEAAPAAALPAADPCSEIPGCEYLAQNPPSTSGCNAGGTYNNVTPLPSGCYNSLTLTGTDTMSGEYVINGQFHLNNATVTGSNVTVYMTSNVSDTNFSNANITLSAPTTGNTANVLFYRVPAQSSALNFSTCTCTFGGLLYFPTTQVDYSNTGSAYSVLVFGSANFSTSHGLDFGSPPNGGSIIQKAVIAQ